MSETPNSLLLPAQLLRNAASSAALTVDSWIGRSRLPAVYGYAWGHLGSHSEATKAEVIVKSKFSGFCMIFDYFLSYQISTCFVGLLGTGGPLIIPTKVG